MDLELALERVQKTRNRGKLSKSERMNYRVLDKLAREGKLKDTWVNQAFEAMMTEEELKSHREWLDSLKRP